MKLPKDLEKRVRKTIWQKSKTCVLWFAALLILIIFFGDVVFPTKYMGMKIIGYILVLALPFIFTKFPFNLIDETYCGTIEHVEIKTSVVNEFLSTSFRGGFGGAKGSYKINTLYLHIVTPEGERIRRKVFSGKTDQGQFLDTYHAGDEVFHLYGTDTVVVLPTEADEHVACAVCGSVNEKENDFCRECGCTLVKDAVWSEENENNV
ncbi:MAG: hypothetical protein IJ021_04890 [Clostridia bacterium]|nr:hypothetical protein [Clostridia bacterium]